ncbi:hypothetical protein BDW62DRAFT_110589 [Aspergillus aurantiobrunneus]
MAETSMPCDVPGWGFDPLNPGPGFNLEPGVAGDEELWYRSHFGMNSFDVPQWQPVEAHQAGYEFASSAPGKTPYQQLSPIVTGPFSSRSDKVLPRSPNLQGDNSAPYSLDDLLRTASQLATERALYMNIPPANNPHSPAFLSSPAAEPAISLPSTSPSHHSNASDTDEHDRAAFEFPQVYQLPEGNGNAAGYFSPLHHLASRDPGASAAAAVPPSTDKTAQSNPRETSLTPLEMPDGTTRFTANWLPVDPQGGFTIRPPASHQHDPLMDLDPYLTMDHQDHVHGNYNYRNAFISLEDPDAGTSAGV